MDQKLNELSEMLNPLIDSFHNEEIKPEIEIDIEVDKQLRARIMVDITVSEKDFKAIEGTDEEKIIDDLREEIQSHGIETVKIKKTFKDGREKFGLRLKKFLDDSDKDAAMGAAVDYIKYLKPYIYVKRGRLSYSVFLRYDLKYRKLYEQIGISDSHEKKEVIENSFIRIKLSLPIAINGSGLNIRDGKTMVWDINPPEDIFIRADFKIPSLKNQPILDYFMEQQ